MATPGFRTKRTTCWRSTTVAASTSPRVMAAITSEVSIFVNELPPDEIWPKIVTAAIATRIQKSGRRVKRLGGFAPGLPAGLLPWRPGSFGFFSFLFSDIVTHTYASQGLR